MKTLNIKLAICASIILSFFFSFALKAASSGSREELVAGLWKITSYTIEPSFWGVHDLQGGIKACEKDIMMEFRNGGELVIYKGDDACHSQPIQERIGFWIFNDEQTQLTINDPEKGVYIADVLEFSNTSIRIRYSYFDEKENAQYTFYNTFSKL